VRRGRVEEPVVELGVDLLTMYRYVCTRLIETKVYARCYCSSIALIKSFHSGPSAMHTTARWIS
jgi:hypothetical protein